MKNLIQNLQQFAHLSPDEIVARITPMLTFDNRTFKPWACPDHLRGRHVLIEWFSEFDEADSTWWRAPGAGSSINRIEGVGWPIEVAFGRFCSYRSSAATYVVLHLLEPGHAQIPDPNTRRDRSPWA